MIKKSSIYMIGIIILIVLFGFFMLRNGSGSLDNDSGGGSNGEAREIILGVRNYNYYPNTIKVNVGETVRIKLDSSVSGCLRSFTIRDFGINKYLKTPDDYVEFTPTKKGTYGFACSMGMGTGTLVVE